MKFAPLIFTLALCLPGLAQDVEPVSEDVKELIQQASGGDAIAQLKLGFKYHFGDGTRKDHREAVKWYRLAAQQGFAGAQYALGLLYTDGEGVPRDDKEAIRWYRLAAEQGLAEAQFNLGLKCDTGKGVPRDDKEAFKWYRLAAEQGHDRAQFNLGTMYAKGEGVPEDDAEAIRWYRLAAEQGLAEAQLNIGVMYEAGEGVPQNSSAAVKWMRLAAEQGIAEAQCNLGRRYSKGEAVPKDDKVAARYYRLAADQGFALAQYSLGLMYDYGEGVLEDDKEAVKWYRLAAYQGYARAQSNLGRMYGAGLGVPEDFVEGHAWYNIASSQGDEAARSNKALISRRMTPEQIAQAQALARELLAQIEKNRAAKAAGAPTALEPAGATASPPDATGTGFAVTADGRILTAFHVIKDASRIRVTLADGRKLPATVQAASRSNDLALLKVGATGLVPLRLASTRSIKVGAELFTVGFPVVAVLGREAKYTSGALSSKSGIQGEASLMQITVPIQPGNSGGPVVTKTGRVVGIVTSSAAITSFLEITGTLPQNVNWAIKAEYASLLFESEEVPKDTSSLEKAIERAMKAVCLIEVWTNAK